MSDGALAALADRAHLDDVTMGTQRP